MGLRPNPAAGRPSTLHGVNTLSYPGFVGGSHDNSARRLAAWQREQARMCTLVVSRCPEPPPCTHSMFMPIMGGDAPGLGTQPAHKRVNGY
jgi:hypothetical protein